MSFGQRTIELVAVLTGAVAELRAQLRLLAVERVADPRPAAPEHRGAGRARSMPVVLGHRHGAPGTAPRRRRSGRPAGLSVGWSAAGLAGARPTSAAAVTKGESFNALCVPS
jgi:hypothetical protein